MSHIPLFSFIQRYSIPAAIVIFTVWAFCFSTVEMMNLAIGLGGGFTIGAAWKIP